MNKATGARDTFALLARLREEIRRVSASSEGLETEWRAALAQERRRMDQLCEQKDLDLAALENDALEHLETRRTFLDDWYAARQRRIRLAARSVREKHFQEIAANESRLKFNIQRDRLQAERNREKNIADANGRFARGQESLDQCLAAVNGLSERMTSVLDVTAPAPAESDRPVLDDSDETNVTKLQQLTASLEKDFETYRRRPLTALFRMLPLAGALSLLAGAHGLAFFVVKMASVPGVTPAMIGGSWAGTSVLAVVLGYVAGSIRRPAVASLQRLLAGLGRFHDESRAQLTAHHERDLADATTLFERTIDELNRQWDENIDSSARSRLSVQDESNQRSTDLLLTLQQSYDRRRAASGAQVDAVIATRRRVIESRWDNARKTGLDREKVIRATHESKQQALASSWKAAAADIKASFDSSGDEVARLFPQWADLTDWKPSTTFPRRVPFGTASIHLEKLAGMPLPAGPLAWIGERRFDVPLLLEFPTQGSLLMESGKSGRGPAIAAINATLMRLLTAAPPGRLTITLIDPVGLGQSFPGITHLADHGEQLLSGRVLTQQGQIEDRLAELNEHMEKVIQKYLRNDFPSIIDYNEKAGSIAERFHFVAVADFPAGFTEAATRRLLSIASSGARCGVYTLIYRDTSLPSPSENILGELRKASIRLEGRDGGYIPESPAQDGVTITLDTPPDAVRMTELIETVGTASRNASRVEVPFGQIAPTVPELWSMHSTSELRVAVGRTGATKFQQLALGQGTRQHGLIAGKTGSGKSTLFHVIITNLALWYSPSEVEFYLVDFKKGVEFQCYATNRLPHAKVIAIESDREFGLSVLQRLDEELRRRGELFRKAGAQDLPGYLRNAGTATLPRTLLLIDEFQEFFVEDDRIAQGAALLLDRIVRQGRAFGIHVLLGSQTLGGAYTLARATLGQMVVRIALQCNEADAMLIMDDTNPAARLLTRPGEGIYNDAAGAVEGNSPFQTVWLPDDVRDQYLKQVRSTAESRGLGKTRPVIFDGNAPGDVRENDALEALLRSTPSSTPTGIRMWLGAPNSIKGPTEVLFTRQSGNHLLFVGQRDEVVNTLLGIGILSLAAHIPAGGARFIVIDGSAPEPSGRGPFTELARNLPGTVHVPRGAEIDVSLTGLGEELKRRNAEMPADAPSVFLIINGLQRFKRFRHEDDFGFGGGDDGAIPPGKIINELICEGAPLGIHVLVVCDTYGNLTRFLSRKAVSEFAQRILFQMSATDSASLIDTPKASTLGLHRALLHNEQEGQLELFRPYAEPDAGWFEEAVRRIAHR